ncbi:MAG: hydroxypyruvate isomerase [SAR202 cluster bacterium]|jgi:hydroxypyruvate isomerase|nr:hydroxypyruvate isomerase [SAR202 cluster bacterium]
MPRFSANLTMMFNEYDFLDRYGAAARAGFKAVEYNSPYEYDKERLAEELNKNGLTQALFNMPAGDWGAGERGFACLPDRVGEFQETVGSVVEYAPTLGCERVNCLSGITPEGVAPDKLRETLVSNVRFAAEKLAAVGVTVLLEAINTVDMPGFYLNTTTQARSIVEEIDLANVGYQYDAYHMQVMEGDLARTIKSNLDIIGHIQIADNPERHEPGTGEINYPFLLKYLDEVGYDGWVGCEYRPLANTEDGLGWLKPYLG